MNRGIPFSLKIRCTAVLCLLAASVCFSAPAFQKIHVGNGTLRFGDGSEVNLWGVNFQPSLSWEYSRMAQSGVQTPFDRERYLAMINEGFDEIQRLGSNLIRVHLSPADFSDANGNLVENRWLDLTDYVLAEAEKRGIYIYLAFLNDMRSGFSLKNSFAVQDEKTKANWMIDPEFMKKADTFIHQILNRSNPYNGDKKYKDSPALVIVEPINEPGYFKREELSGFPACEAVYQNWLKEHHQNDTAGSYTEFRVENTKNYINRMKKFFADEGCAAVMSWSMEWPRMMEWTGEDVFEAAADSDAELVSVCLYPGQSEAYHKRGEELRMVGEKNYLGYLRQTYEDSKYHGWLLEQRFRSKARIVYEFETYYNQTACLYPEMAKLFRSLGIQAAAMWGYLMPGEAECVAAGQNLNLKTTPNKAASFMAAGEVFRSQPRFERYSTSSETADYFKNTALSCTSGSCAYSDGAMLIYSGTMPDEFARHLKTDSRSLKRIIGCGSSPVVQYDGSGLYFVDIGKDGVHIDIEPDAAVLHPHYLKNPAGGRNVQLSTNVAHSFTLKLPTLGKQSRILRDNDWVEAEKTGSGFVRMDVTPGIYRIQP